MKTHLVLLASIFLLAASGPAESQLAKHYSMSSVLANPEKRTGSLISVSGVLGRTAGALVLYVDSGSEKSQININGFRLDVSGQLKVSDDQVSSMIGKYVIVSGIFDAESPQDRNFSGLLREVSRIRPYPLLTELPN